MTMSPSLLEWKGVGNKLFLNKKNLNSQYWDRSVAIRFLLQTDNQLPIMVIMTTAGDLDPYTGFFSLDLPLKKFKYGKPRLGVSRTS